ncbi:MAG: aldehyde dehydrogenase family protein [Acidimicrobiia bacterium]
MTDLIDPTVTGPAPSGGDAPTDIVKRLRSTFDAGRTRPVEWRTAQLKALKRLLAEGESEMLDALRRDLGKSATEGFVTEIALVRAEIDHTLAHLGGWLRPQKVHVPAKQLPGKARIHRDPLGVVLIIGPWNYPIQLVLAPLVGALAAGNAAVLKPAELSAHASHALARLVPRYLDPDAVAVVEGGVPETTSLLDERWDHIFYTGNGAVGRVVMAAAAKHLTPVTLELGAKSPTIVDRSANLDVAARRIAWGKYTNAGQTCVAPDYVLVDRRVEGPLTARLRDTVRRFYGDDPQMSADYGRIINDRHFARLGRLLDDDGAGEVVYGGERDENDRYLAPTAVRGTEPTSPMMQEEIFGPVLPLIAVDDVDAAIEFVNAREKPLALYVFTEDADVADRVVANTTAGGMCVNSTVFHLAVPGLPFGGVGESGMGAYHGRATFETFSHAKSVLTKPTSVDPGIAYPPYQGIKAKLLRRLL